MSAAIDQDEALTEFRLLFGDRADLVRSINREDLPASVQLEISSAAEQDNLDRATSADPRIKEVVLGQVTLGRFAAVAYKLVELQLDRLGGLPPEERRADVQSLRTLATQARQDSLHPDVAQEAARAAERLTQFAEDKCGLRPK